MRQRRAFLAGCATGFLLWAAAIPYASAQSSGAGEAVTSSPCCEERPFCDEMGGDYCSDTFSCPSGFDSLGPSGDCRRCCKSDPRPSCGEMGGDYCSQSGSCPPGFSSLGGSNDCSPCCKSDPPRPSCGAMGGDYCSQSGSCPSGFTSLGASNDCRPCCKASPSDEQTGCPNPNGICEPELGETLERCRRDCRDRCDVEDCQEDGDRRRCPSICRPTDSAYVVSSNFPSCLRPGESFVLAITMRNRGDAPWSAEDGIKLSAVGDEDPFTDEIRIEIPPGVVVRPRGGLHTFRITLTAPSVEGISYVTDWQMVREGEARFGSIARERIRVASDCGAPAPSISDYTCRVRVQDADGLPIPNKRVLFEAFTLKPDESVRRLGFAEGRTDSKGTATLGLAGGIAPTNELVCRALGLSRPQSPTFVGRFDPNGIPAGTVLELDVVVVRDFVDRVGFPGLKPGTEAVARLYQSGPYDKPVVIPMPFDPGERGSNPVTENSLYALFEPFARRLYDEGFDLWLTYTQSGQSIHEQAAEFAQLIDEAAKRLGRGGKVIVAGYSLGGVTARLATARYQADPEWREALGVQDELPVSLLAFGDAPLEGAQVNLCLQQGIWRLGRQAEANLDSCAAQQLLRLSKSGVAIPADFNNQRFYVTGGDVFFSPSSDESPCDRRVSGICVCDGGPPVLSVNGNGFPRGMRIIAFSDGEPGPMMCYGDGKDRNRVGQTMCPSVPGPFPREMEAGEIMYKVRLPGEEDVVCLAGTFDVEGGSKVGQARNQRECLVPPFIICGGVETRFNGTFIPYDSAIPPGAPFFATHRNTFQGVHASAYRPSIEFLLEHFRAVTGGGSAPREGVPATGTVTVTLPNVSQRGAETVLTRESGPEAFPLHVNGTPSRYYVVETTSLYHATPSVPATLCIDYDEVRFMRESDVSLFQLQEVGWVDVTSLRDTAENRVCGTTTSLGTFALFEPLNLAPRAHAGGDQTIEASHPGGAAVTLDGTGSFDPDLDAIEIEWLDESGVPLARSAVARVELPVGTHRLRLRVRDERGATAEDVVEVVVWFPNETPVVALSHSGGCGESGCSVTFTVSATDADGDALSYAWFGCGSGTAPSVDCVASRSGEIEVGVIVTDGRTGEATATARVPVYATAWSNGPWGSCEGAEVWVCTSGASDGCRRGGRETRSVSELAWSFEPRGAPPEGERACIQTTQGYAAAYTTGSWSACSRSCGGGRQTRSVTPSAWKETAPAATPPPASRACNTEPCALTCYDYPDTYPTLRECQNQGWPVCERRFRDDGRGGMLTCYKGFN